MITGCGSASLKLCICNAASPWRQRPSEDSQCCQQVYIGETKRLLKFWLAEHRGYVVNGDTTKATGHHFSLLGHSLADLQVTAIEQVKKKDILYRREREEYHIRQFNTLYEGLNKKL